MLCTCKVMTGRDKILLVFSIPFLCKSDFARCPTTSTNFCVFVGFLCMVGGQVQRPLSAPNFSMWEILWSWRWFCLCVFFSWDLSFRLCEGSKACESYWRQWFCNAEASRVPVLMWRASIFVCNWRRKRSCPRFCSRGRDRMELSQRIPFLSQFESFVFYLIKLCT